MSCKQCGKCCTAIGVSISWENLNGIDGEDGEFMRSHWHPMSREAAMFLNPHLRSNGFGEAESKYFYSCDMFDVSTNMCIAHDSKPPVCKNYPHYGKKATRELVTSYSDDCGYLKDLA